MDVIDLAVAQESKLIWYDDPLRYPYLRQAVRRGYRRAGAISRGGAWSTGARVVGYAVLRPDADKQEGTRYLRRVFWCKQADRDGERTCPPACEAVDPCLIEPGVRTPWLFEEHDPETAGMWLVARRYELGLVGGQSVSSRPQLTPGQAAL